MKKSEIWIVAYIYSIICFCIHFGIEEHKSNKLYKDFYQAKVIAVELYDENESLYLAVESLNSYIDKLEQNKLLKDLLSIDDRNKAIVLAIAFTESSLRYDAKHNDSKTRLYNIWCSMIDRVENKKSTSYEDYGGRGITICEEWRNNYPSFKKWALQNGYSNSLKIDRIDNDLGYFPNNCRWATQTIQSRNTRRLRSNNTSGYRGVCWHKKQQKFNSRITVNSIVINLGSYCTDIEAAKAYDKYVIDNNLEHTLNGVTEL